MSEQDVDHTGTSQEVVKLGADSSSSNAHAEWFSIILLLLLIIGSITVIGLVLMTVRRWKTVEAMAVDEDISSDLQDLDTTVERGCFGYRGRLSFPHGKFSVVPILSVGVAFYLTVFSITTCEFVSVNETASDGQKETIMSVGFWSFSYPYITEDIGDADTCAGYSADETFDIFFRTAKILGIVSTAVSGICVLLTFQFACATIKRVVLRWTIFALFLCSICQGLTLLVFISDYCVGEHTCEADWGAYSSIVVVVYLLASALAIALVRPSAKKTSENNDDEETREPLSPTWTA